MSVSDHIAAALRRDVHEALQSSIGFKDDIAESLATAVVGKIQQRWGGQKIYISVNNDSVERNQAIKQEFTGDNHAEICRRYNISLSTLYRIIKQSKL